MSTSRIRVLQVILPMAIWLASIGVAEGVFRALGRRPSDDYRGVYESFGDQNYKLRPNIDSFADWYSGAFWICTDAISLRCDRDRRTGLKPQARIGLLVLGDSQGFGQGVDHEQSIVGSIQRESRAGDFVVANASVGGHLLNDQLQLAQHLHEKAELQVGAVLLLVSPRLVALAGGSATAYAGRDGRLYGAKPGRLRLLRTWPKSNSVVYVTLRDAYKSLKKTPTTNFAALGFYSVSEERKSNLYISLQSLKNWCDEIDVTLVLAYLPLSSEFGISASTSPPGGPAPISFDAPTEMLREVAQRIGVGLIDTRPLLASLHEAGQQLHLRGDYHYNAITSRAVGRYIAEQLRDKGIPDSTSLED